MYAAATPSHVHPQRAHAGVRGMDARPSGGRADAHEVLPVRVAHRQHNAERAGEGSP